MRVRSPEPEPAAPGPMGSRRVTRAPRRARRHAMIWPKMPPPQTMMCWERPVTTLFLADFRGVRRRDRGRERGVAFVGPGVLGRERHLGVGRGHHDGARRGFTGSWRGGRWGRVDRVQRLAGGFRR